MNKTFWVSTALALTALSGCQEYDPRFFAATQNVKNLLLDPKSAEFRNLRVSHSDYVCGEVNSKNRMGGYVGFVRFYAKSEEVVIEDETSYVGPNAELLRLFFNGTHKVKCL